MQMVDFTMVVTGNFTRPVVRMSQEGVKIASAIRARDQGGLDLELLNSKKEFHQAGQINPHYKGLFAWEDQMTAASNVSKSL